jgi:hypothetical protein
MADSGDSWTEIIEVDYDDPRSEGEIIEQYKLEQLEKYAKSILNQINVQQKRQIWNQNNPDEIAPSQKDKRRFAMPAYPLAENYKVVRVYPPEEEEEEYDALGFSPISEEEETQRRFDVEQAANTQFPENFGTPPDQSQWSLEAQQAADALFLEGLLTPPQANNSWRVF